VHTGVINGRLAVHLPLIVSPERGALSAMIVALGEFDREHDARDAMAGAH
jgi:hypothetical protein